jgi:hypothetical protein
MLPRIAITYALSAYLGQEGYCLNFEFREGKQCPGWELKMTNPL